MKQALPRLIPARVLAKPPRSRSFSVDRYGYNGAFARAVQARADFVAGVQGFIGVAPIPERFRPAQE